MPKSPTERSMIWLRDKGYIVDVSERWIPRTKVRKDLFGFADLVACGPGLGIKLIQVTSFQHVGERVTKMKANPNVPVCCGEKGIEVWVMGWWPSKPDPRIVVFDKEGHPEG